MIRGGILSLSLALLFLNGCSSPKPAPETMQLRADRMIEENKTEDAIEMLSNEISRRDTNSPDGLDKSSDTAELRICLASAFAKKAVITIRNIAQGIQLAETVSKLGAIQTGGDVTSTDHGVIQFETFMLSIMKFVETFESIPKVDTANLPFLNEAIRLLDSNPVQPRHGLVYAAILKIIKARSLLESDMLMADISAKTNKDGDCDINVNSVIDKLQEACDIIISGLGDFGSASAKDLNNIKKDQAEVTSIENSFDPPAVRQAAPILISADALKRINLLLGTGFPAVSCSAGDTTASH